MPSSTFRLKNRSCSWSGKARWPARRCPACISTVLTTESNGSGNCWREKRFSSNRPPGVSALRTSDEVRAAIVLFASLLDEQQGRLYAGLESLQRGRGGDRQIAELLHLDPHPVAKGRQRLLAQKVEVGRVRHVGGGRQRVEKKRPPSSMSSTN